MTIEKTIYGEYAIIHSQNEIREVQEVIIALLKSNLVIRCKEENKELFSSIKDELAKSGKKFSWIIEFQKPNEILDLNCTLKINY